MSYEFDLRRHEDKIESLLAEQERLNLQIPSLRRDEQIEINRLQRDFNRRMNNIETRLIGIKKELEDEERQRDRAIAGVEKEKKEKAEEEEEKTKEKVESRYHRF